MELKLMSYNVEWMANFFVTGKAEFYIGKSRYTGRLGRKPKDVQKVCQKIAGVIKDIDPDILGIQEGPPKISQMKLFVKEYLDNKYDVYSMEHTRQSIHTLVKKNLPVQIKQLKEDHAIYRHLKRKIEFYTWDNVQKKKQQNFTRKPTVLQLTHKNQRIEIMVFHTKSKISRLRSPSQWEEKDVESIIDALRSRQKLSQELAAVRRYITHAVFSRVNGVILMGDLNDGPNRDIFEDKFLITNILDELRGGFDREESLMHHCLTQKQLIDKKIAYTSDFNDPTKQGKKVNVLLDHILYSDGIYNPGNVFQIAKGKSKIEHAVYKKYLTNNGNTGDDRPSDHIPITSILKVKD